MTFCAPRPQPGDDDFDPTADLLAVLDLVPAAQVDDAQAGAAAGTPGGTGCGETDDVYLGASQPTPHGRVYGGQVVAQAVVAAGRTVADLDGPRRSLHSLHGYFLRAGDANEPIRFEVERLRDGGSFSARRVHALQHGHVIFSMMASFQTAAGGMDHQIAMPPVPMPDELATAGERLADAPAGRIKDWTVHRPVDMRHCETPLYLRPAPLRNDRQHVWLRTTGALPDDPLIHTAAVAYASDYSILEAVLRRHGVHWSDPRLRPASLDHAMWFHRPVRADEWLLYAEGSPSAGGGRGFGIGHMFTAEGTLVATVAQEGMLRLREG